MTRHQRAPARRLGIGHWCLVGHCGLVIGHSTPPIHRFIPALPFRHPPAPDTLDESWGLTAFLAGDF